MIFTNSNNDYGISYISTYYWQYNNWVIHFSLANCIVLHKIFNEMIDAEELLQRGADEKNDYSNGRKQSLNP